MAVAFVGAAPAGTANPTTSFAIAAPSVIAGADVYVAVTSRDHTSGIAFPTVTDNEAGGQAWTRIASSVDRKATLWWKKAISTWSDTVQITVAGCVGSAAGGYLACSGTPAGDPTTNLTIETNAAGDESHASFTPAVAQSMIVLVVFNTANDNAVTTPTMSPGAMTIRFEKLSTGGSDCGCTVSTAIKADGTATGLMSWAQVNGTTYSIAFAIQPAAADRRARIGWTEFEVPDVVTSTVELVEGSTVRASWTGIVEPAAFVTAGLTITAGQMATIVDPTNLRVRVRSTGAGGARARYSQIFLESPPVATSVIELVEGTIVRASWTVAENADWVTDGLPLSMAQLDSITNWTDVRVRIRSTGTGDIRARYSHVALETPPLTTDRRALLSWLELETPELPPRRAQVGWMEFEVPDLVAVTTVIELLEGSAVRKTWPQQEPSAFEFDAIDLTPEEMAAIKDWTNVRVRLRSTGPAGVRARYSQVYFEAPAAAAAQITGTVTQGLTESNIVAGGKTLIITLKDTEWIP